MSDGGGGDPQRTNRFGVGIARALLQVFGFAVGIALLVWCARRALAPENQEQLQRLRDVAPADAALILVVSLATLAVNGLVFWVMLRPVKRVDVAGMLSTNALATFLNYLPFKIGVLTRVLVHNRRDGVPVMTIGAWFTTMGVVVVISLMPPCAATLWLKTVDWRWGVVSAAGICVLAALTVVVSKFFDGQAGRERLARFVSLVPLGPRFARSHFFDQAHAGAAILAHGPTVVAAIALRLVDIGLQTARFVLVARVLHEDIGVDRALMAAVTFFLTGIVSPAGMLGTREGVTTWLFGSSGAQSLAAVTLLVGGAELVVNFIGAAAGLAYLRPDRLVRWRRAGNDGAPGRGGAADGP